TKSEPDSRGLDPGIHHAAARSLEPNAHWRRGRMDPRVTLRMGRLRITLLPREKEGPTRVARGRMRGAPSRGASLTDNCYAERSPSPRASRAPSPEGEGYLVALTAPSRFASLANRHRPRSLRRIVSVYPARRIAAPPGGVMETSR